MGSKSCPGLDQDTMIYRLAVQAFSSSRVGDSVCARVFFAMPMCQEGRTRKARRTLVIASECQNTVPKQAILEGW